MYIVSPSRYQYGLLAMLILLGISMGFWNEILSPTLPNLCARLNVSYEKMGYVMSMRSIGNIMVLLFVAVIYDSFPYLVHYFMFAECLLGGISTVLIPWCKHYWMVSVLFIIQSGCQSSMTNGCHLTILRTFKERSIGKMQLYHLGYGIGGILSGVTSHSFLKKSSSIKVKLTKYCNRTRAITKLRNLSLPFNITKVSVTYTRNFEYIYLIAGVFAMCSAITFLCFKCLRNSDDDTQAIKVTKRESWCTKINPKYIADGNIFFGLTMIILLFFYYFFYVCGLFSFYSYIVVYALDPCKNYVLSHQEATYLIIALNAFFLLGRVIAIFLIDPYPVLSLLTINALNILFNIVLVLLSHKYALALWIGACGMRLCNSIVYPSGTSFVNRYIIVTSSVISVALIGSTLGMFAGLALGGFLVDNYPSYYTTYSCICAMSMLMLTVLFMVILGSKHGIRNFHHRPKCQEIDKKILIPPLLRAL